jgi:hypothetical protein
VCGPINLCLLIYYRVLILPFGMQVGKTTSFFANTPDQYAGHLTTDGFTAYWKANDPDWVPNAALVRDIMLVFDIH